MVTRYGMSEVVGPVSLEEESSSFLRDPFFKPSRSYSEDTQHAVDQEVREVISRCEKRAVEIITRGDRRTEPSHFDPQVLDAFERVADGFQQIYESLAEPVAAMDAS